MIGIYFTLHNLQKQVVEGKVLIEIASPKMILPEGVASLSRTLSQETYHGRLGLRHPFGIHNISLQRILPRFEAVLDALDDLQKDSDFKDRSKTKWEDRLLTNQELLLYALCEYIEDCYNIILAFFPDSETGKKSSIFRKFKKEIASYRADLATIVNAIKHKQRRLRIVVLYKGNECVPGYFVEGVIDDETVGPDPIVHKELDTPFSFFYDLRYHAAHLFIVSNALAQGIDELTRNNSDDNEYLDTESEQPFIHVLSRISKLPNLIFPNEFGLDWPQIEFSHEAHINSLRISYPAKEYDVLTLGNANVLASVRADGVTRSFQFPFLRKLAKT